MRKGKDPDPDPGGPKTCGSFGSGSLTLMRGIFLRNITFKVKVSTVLFLCALMVFQIFEKLTVVIFNCELFYLLQKN